MCSTILVGGGGSLLLLSFTEIYNYHRGSFVLIGTNFWRRQTFTPSFPLLPKLSRTKVRLWRWTSIHDRCLSFTETHFTLVTINLGHCVTLERLEVRTPRPLGKGKDEVVSDRPLTVEIARVTSRFYTWSPKSLLSSRSTESRLGSGRRRHH